MGTAAAPAPARQPASPAVPQDVPPPPGFDVTGGIRRRAAAADELSQRGWRPPDHLGESRALVGLMRALKHPTGAVLQELAETALRLCRAHSAGVSIAEEPQKPGVFRWLGAAGRWSGFLGGTVPYESDSRGMTQARCAPVLLCNPERLFTPSPAGMPAVAEALLVPFKVEDRVVGTLWVVAHDASRMFDREDLRLLTSLGEFASVACHVIQQQKQSCEALNRELAGSQLLQTLSSGLILEDDIGAFYEKILDAAMAIMHSQFASLQMLDGNGELQLLAWRGFHQQSAAYWQTVHLDSVSSCGETLRARQRFIIADTARHAALAGTGDMEEYKRSGIRSVQSTPLIARNGKLIGVVSTHWREPHAPTSSELRIFDVLARETADLIERANTQAALREADRRKDEFLAVLGHELRNPLAPLSMGVELLQRGGHSPERVDAIQSMIRRQLVHLTRLVDDLMDLARITRGQMELRRAPLDLRNAIEAAIELARPWIDERGHELTVRHEAPALPLDGDAERLTQVVANLLNNAAKYMDPGGAILLRSGVEGGMAVLRVRDRGFGIPAERLADVFEMFSRLPEHRARRGVGGLGIGLALSRRLIELHGGSLSVASEGLGLGSEFEIRLPLARAADAGQGDAADAPGAAATPRRVLVVDDNVDAAISLRLALELGGHTVSVVHDAMQALEMLPAFAPEALLVDIGLPEADGYELARRIRSLPGGQGLLLVAVTGWGQESDRERARAAGFDVHMTKPVSIPDVEAVLAAGKENAHAHPG
ncbi:hypothetical protein GCM10023144_47850 [Pigmentiphaga soli]|uniref:histidine kinase n=1 Tax=Pigmentiphaga soli TaxID=1007095 RepID=A0ABP8HTL6_9BURK